MAGGGGSLFHGRNWWRLMVVRNRRAWARTNPTDMLECHCIASCAATCEFCAAKSAGDACMMHAPIDPLSSETGRQLAAVMMCWMPLNCADQGRRGPTVRSLLAGLFRKVPALQLIYLLERGPWLPPQRILTGLPRGAGNRSPSVGTAWTGLPSMPPMYIDPWIPVAALSMPCWPN